jgi:putative membrane protein
MMPQTRTGENPMKMLAIAAVLLAPLAAQAALDDPQIADVALTAHRIDVERGKLALKHTKNAEVRQFADQMVNDHQAGIREAMDLAKQLGVKPQPSDVSKSLEADAKKASARLRKESGSSFDKDYIDTEVAYHQAVIDAVKNTLVPGAQNAQLKTLLENAVPTLEGHLQHAKMVQAQLGKRAAR